MSDGLDKRKGERSPRREQARSMKASGMSYAQIGDVMGVSRQRAQKLVAPTELATQTLRQQKGNKCEECGRFSKKLDLHHDDYNGGPPRLLCVPCHRHASVKGENVVQISISLDPESIRMVRNFGHEAGIRGFSSTMRTLIHQFDKLRSAAAAEVEGTAAALLIGPASRPPDSSRKRATNGGRVPQAGSST